MDIMDYLHFYDSVSEIRCELAFQTGLSQRPFISIKDSCASCLFPISSFCPLVQSPSLVWAGLHDLSIQIELWFSSPQEVAFSVVRNYKCFAGLLAPCLDRFWNNPISVQDRVG